MSWRRRNIYLIGLPGAGKTAVGRELAELLKPSGFAFVDLDEEVERVAGATVADIFSTHGEPAFREYETEALLDLSEGGPKVIATGGGAVILPINRAILRGSGIAVWIDAPVERAVSNLQADRTAGKERPMFAGRSRHETITKLNSLLVERRAFYAEASVHINPDSQHDPGSLAECLLEKLEALDLKQGRPHSTLLAHSALGDYTILVGQGIATSEAWYFLKDGRFKSAVIVTDSNVDRLHGDAFLSELQQYTAASVDISKIVIDAGESSKNWDTISSIIDGFHQRGASRRSTAVIALGGGVVTDIAGFAASLYNRGLPLFHIPTTLLSQADASIGGKTGIDFFGEKNSIGTFYPPRQVIVDTSFLETLPKRELRAGLAEIVKYALIGNALFFEELRGLLPTLVNRTDAGYDNIVYRSIVEKLRYVESDEFERKQGIRELLNFGHTFGHALEAATNFQILHGEAVLLGMRGAAWLSNKLAYLSHEELAKIESLLSQIPNEANIEISVDAAMAAMKRDKKGANRVVLLRNIGEAFVTEISDEDARLTIEYILTLQ